MNSRVDGVEGRVRAACARLNRGRFPIGSRRALTRAEERGRRVDLDEAKNDRFKRTIHRYVQMEIDRMNERKRKEGCGVERQN